MSVMESQILPTPATRVGEVTEITLSEIGYEELPPTSSVPSQLFAGAAAGVLEHCVMYPFDNVKTRMQIVQGSVSIYTGIPQAISNIIKMDGIYGLWRGMSSVIVGAGPAHALYFASYEQCKKVLSDRFAQSSIDSSFSPFVHGAAGAMATIISDAVMNPFDVIKQRLQVYGTYKGLWNCASTIFKSEGVRAFYISYPTTLMMTIPFQSIHFACYESFRRKINPSGVYDPLSHILAGGTAGAIAAAATTPLDVAKTLLQTKSQSKDARVRQCNGLVDAFKVIYLKRGVRGFSRGLLPRVLTHMPSTAICWVTYEYFKWVLLKQPKRPIDSS